MKKFFIFTGLFFLLIVAVVLVNTLRFTSQQIKFNLAKDININLKEITNHLTKALQFKTISNKDLKKINSKEFLGLQNYLKQTFPLIHKKLKKEVINNYSLLYKWEGKNKNLKPILLMAHLDVVPIESGTEKKWKYPPFSGKIAKGFIWSRGAMDDKLSVLGILEAGEYLLKKNFQPQRTIYFAFGADEEISGENGAKKIVASLKSKNVQLEYVLDEGLAVIKKGLPGIKVPVALIGIAEKGYVSVELTVNGAGGHSSTPPAKTTIGILSEAITKLEKNQMPADIKGPVKLMFAYIGPEAPLAMKMVFANLWLFKKIIINQLAKISATNALMRTTTAPTIFNSGVKDNVLPSKAKAVINFRILPGDTVESVLAHIKKTINNSQIKIKILSGASNPSNISSINTFGFKVIQKSIGEIFSPLIIAPSLVIGASDSRHYSVVTKNIYKFLPLMVTQDDLERIHGTNERIAINNYEKVVKFYIQLIRNSN